MGKITSVKKLKEKEVLFLYKACLGLAREIGFKPGDTRINSYKPINYHKLNYSDKKKILNSLKKEDLGESILGQPVRYGIDNLNHLVPESVDLFFAVGDNSQRADLYHRFVAQGFNCPSLIHPSAFVDESVSIGPSNYIGSQVNISGD